MNMDSGLGAIFRGRPHTIIPQMIFRRRFPCISLCKRGEWMKAARRCWDAPVCFLCISVVKWI